MRLTETTSASIAYWIAVVSASVALTGSAAYCAAYGATGSGSPNDTRTRARNDFRASKVSPTGTSRSGGTPAAAGRASYSSAIRAAPVLMRWTRGSAWVVPSG